MNAARTLSSFLSHMILDALAVAPEWAAEVLETEADLGRDDKDALHLPWMMLGGVEGLRDDESIRTTVPRDCPERWGPIAEEALRVAEEVVKSAHSYDLNNPEYLWATIQVLPLKGALRVLRIASEVDPAHAPAFSRAGALAQVWLGGTMRMVAEIAPGAEYEFPGTTIKVTDLRDTTLIPDTLFFEPGAGWLAAALNWASHQSPLGAVWAREEVRAAAAKRPEGIAFVIKKVFFGGVMSVERCLHLLAALERQAEKMASDWRVPVPTAPDEDLSQFIWERPEEAFSLLTTGSVKA